MKSIYKKIKNANPAELRRWRFVFWTSFLSVSMLFASLLLLASWRGASFPVALTGPKLEREISALAHPPLYAVMIDNAFEARPQSGLNQAKLIFEAPVEGGYTRFMAIFDSEKGVEEIGPVRSIRPYFIDWAKSLGATVAHIGGSPAAIEQLKSYPYPNIDGMSTGCCFWRSKERFAPHNTYTSLDLLKRNREELPLPTLPFAKKGIEAESGEENLGIEIILSKGFRPAVFRYNPILKTYVRYQGQEVLKDALDHKPVLVENIVVLKTDIAVIDEKSRRSLETVGEGEAEFFISGKLERGKWRRQENSFLELTDERGEMIKFSYGKIWIVVVDQDTKLTYF